MSKMSIETIKEIFTYAELVYNGQMERDKAAIELTQKVGYSDNSHKMYFEIYRCMMLGQGFSRATNVDMINIFLKEILLRYGKIQLENALKAVQGFIQYYYRKFGQSQPGMREMCQGLADSNKIIISFNMDMFENLTDPRREDSIWIFQSNPKYYDIMKAINELDTISWRITQYQKKIKKGNKVYIWISGTGGGLAASGTILSDPENRKWETDEYTLSEKLHKDKYLAVDIHLERKFTDSIIERSLLLNDKRTQNLEVLLYPNATNFKVTKEQDEVIESIIDGTYKQIPLRYQETGFKNEKRKYGMYAPGQNSSKWDEFYENKIMGIGWDELGDLTQYSSKEEMKEKMKELYGEEYSYVNDGHATWQFANEIKVGDVIFAKKGRQKLVGRGIVSSGYVFDDDRDEFKHIHSIDWTHRGEWDHDNQLVMKALTDITPYTDFCKKLEQYFNNDEIETKEMEIKKPNLKYEKDDFLEDVFISEEEYNIITKLLDRKKNLIIQGAPGVGKTYTARRLAYSLMGEQDDERVMMVQFHQSYSYEDFIMGYRPTEKGFELKKGPFYEFCKEAEVDGRPHYFIIDEINRGNLSKIFGELLMLIESDKRGQELRLLYLDELFSVPKNVYIIGLMNTADRSLAIIDYALRRRFSFFHLNPQFKSDSTFAKYLENCGAEEELINRIIKKISYINEIILKDVNLGKGFCIGHSYFCDYNGDSKWYEDIINYEIKPLLEEYYADDESDVVEKYVLELLG